MNSENLNFAYLKNDLTPISFSYDDLLKKHLLVIGQTGSGKTTSVKAIVNELQKINYTNIIFDPTGEYDDYQNSIKMTLGKNTFIDISKLHAKELIKLIGLKTSVNVLNKMELAINSLRIQNNIKHKTGVYKKINKKWTDFNSDNERLKLFGYDYNVRLLADQIVQEYVIPYADSKANYDYVGQELDYENIRRDWHEILAIKARVNDPKIVEFFNLKSHIKRAFKTELTFTIKQFEAAKSLHRSLVINLAPLQDFEHMQSEIISLLFKFVLLNRAKTEQRFPVTVVIDEAHRYLPKQSKLNHNGIFQVLREGRKFGINLIVSTQSPLDLPNRMRGQFSTLLVHEMSNEVEIQSILDTPDFIKEIRSLAVGEAQLTFKSRARYSIIIEEPT
ncbi:MAG: ATP-binding protein [Lactobacillaceae bacterium]|jgi:ABC-type dipeptide/oligopeptide/nickel transport system ATPase component|nr:ATP-binding protein [Lactobacillaceae bacterium]